MPKNKVENRKNAGGFVDIVRDIARQEIADGDTTAVCTVESVNADGTLNLYVLPDTHNVITNVINQCRFDFQSGDTALLYKIGNRTSNAFVIAKYNAKQSETPLAKSGVETSVIDLAKQDRTLNNVTKANKKNITVINQNISNINNDIAVISSKLGIISTKISYLNGDITRIDSSIDSIWIAIHNINPQMEVIDLTVESLLDDYADGDLIFASYTFSGSKKYYSGSIKKTTGTGFVTYNFNFDGLDANLHYSGEKTRMEGDSGYPHLYAGDVFDIDNLTIYSTATNIYYYDPTVSTVVIQGTTISTWNNKLNNNNYEIYEAFVYEYGEGIGTIDGKILVSDYDSGTSYPDYVIKLKKGDILFPIHQAGNNYDSSNIDNITTPVRFIIDSSGSFVWIRNLDLPVAKQILQDSSYAVAGGVIYTALQGKQDTITNTTDLSVRSLGAHADHVNTIYTNNLYLGVDSTDIATLINGKMDVIKFPKYTTYTCVATSTINSILNTTNTEINLPATTALTDINNKTISIAGQSGGVYTDYTMQVGDIITILNSSVPNRYLRVINTVAGGRIGKLAIFDLSVKDASQDSITPSLVTAGEKYRWNNQNSIINIASTDSLSTYTNQDASIYKYTDNGVVTYYIGTIRTVTETVQKYRYYFYNLQDEVYYTGAAAVSGNPTFSTVFKNDHKRYLVNTTKAAQLYTTEIGSGSTVSTYSGSPKLFAYTDTNNKTTYYWGQVKGTSAPYSLYLKAIAGKHFYRSDSIAANNTFGDILVTANKDYVIDHTKLFSVKQQLDTKISGKAGKGQTLVTSGSFSNNIFTISDYSSIITDGLYWITYGNCQTFAYLNSTMINNATSSSPIRIPMPVIDSGGSATPGTLRIEKSGSDLTVRLQGVGNGYTMYFYRTNLA